MESDFPNIDENGESTADMQALAKLVLGIDLAALTTGHERYEAVETLADYLAGAVHTLRTNLLPKAAQTMLFDVLTA